MKAADVRPLRCLHIHGSFHTALEGVSHSHLQMQKVKRGYGGGVPSFGFQGVKTMSSPVECFVAPLVECMRAAREPRINFLTLSSL